jgi:hypothetical protein
LKLHDGADEDGPSRAVDDDAGDRDAAVRRGNLRPSTRWDEGGAETKDGR